MSRPTVLLFVLAAIVSTACGSDDGLSPEPGPAPDSTARYALAFEAGTHPLLTQTSIFVIPPGESARRPLFGSTIFAAQPSASKDGRTVAYVAAGTSDDDPQDLWVWRRGAAGTDGSTQRIALSGGIEYAPSISPDGSRVAYIKVRDDGVSQLWVASVDGSGERQVTTSLPGVPSGHASPAWSPDGQRIAFASGAPGALAVWVMDADGRNLQRITGTSASSDYDIAWSPDMSRLVFARGSSPAAIDLVIVEIASRQERAFGLARRNRQPAWSPDGSRIAFVSNMDGGDDTELWMVKPDGTGLERITMNDVNERSPAWLRIN